MAIKVTGAVTSPADMAGSTVFWENYTQHNGLRRAQFKHLMRDSDYWEEPAVRYSDDNGRTWGPWQDTDEQILTTAPDGSWEMIYMTRNAYHWNPVHKHYFGVMRHLIWPEGHKATYASHFQKGGLQTWDHAYMLVREEKSDTPEANMIRYEPGPPFNPEDPINPGHGLTNFAVAYMEPAITPEGDVILAMVVPMLTCLRLRGIDPATLFPTRPGGTHGFIVARGVWNGKTYDFTYSRPVVLGDLLSSRGIAEPATAMLESGRIVLVFRGTNWQADWTRIEPGTPGYKWYCWSEDGGKTFTEPVPWHFNTGEVVYSSATISHFIRSEKNGKLYWIGNITDPVKTSGNYPRWPLQIVEVDDRYGIAKKETLTVIDTRRDGEPETVQLSNFHLLQDRETGDIELSLCKFGQSTVSTWYAESWKYRISVE